MYDASAPSAAMITLAIAATAAIRVTLWPGIHFAISWSQRGGLCPPRTLSMMIWRRQGAARLIAVSSNVASRMIETQPRYGRRSLATRRTMSLPVNFPSSVDFIGYNPNPERDSTALLVGTNRLGAECKRVQGKTCRDSEKRQTGALARP